MATLEQVLADVADESTKIDSLSTLVAGLRQQAADAGKAAGLTPEQQAQIDAIFEGVEANKAKVQSALDSGVAPAPAP